MLRVLGGVQEGQDPPAGDQDHEQREPAGEGADREQPQQQGEERAGVPRGVVAGQRRARRLAEGCDQDRRPGQQQEGHRGEQAQLALAQGALDEVARDVGVERQE